MSAFAVLLLAGGCLDANPDWDGDAPEVTDAGSGSGSTTTAAATTSPTTSSSGTSTAGTSTSGTSNETLGGSSGQQDTEGGATTGGPKGRVTDGLVVLYQFANAQGITISDEAGLEPALDLQVDGSARLTSDGLSISGNTILTTIDVAAMRIAADELTVEMWVDSQSAQGINDGPRVIAFEEHTQGITNFYVAGTTGLVSLTVPADGTGATDDFVMNVEPGIRHLVFTVDPLGEIAGYENGTLEVIGTTGSLMPSLWMDNLPFVVANASDNGHRWVGEMGLIAIYDRALSADEVQNNFEQGY